MAETLLLPVVRGVLGKAADALVQKVTAMWGVDDDRRDLELKLLYVQPCWPTPRRRRRWRTMRPRRQGVDEGAQGRRVPGR